MSIAWNGDRYDENLNVPVGISNSLNRAKVTPDQISISEVVSEFAQDADDGETAGRTNLPALATANDIREVVQYLKQRPDGVNICDVVQPIKKRIFFPAKVAAYLFWGLVTKDRERLKLTTLGWEFARSLEPEAEAYRTLLTVTGFYDGALRWINDQGMDLVTMDDLVDHWESTSSEVGRRAHQVDIGKSVVSFFHLCQAAELGTMTIGKRGQPARLRVWRAALHEYIHRISPTKNRPDADDNKNVRLLVSRANGNGFIEEVRRVLKQGGIETEVIEEVDYVKDRPGAYVALTICAFPT